MIIDFAVALGRYFFGLSFLIFPLLTVTFSSYKRQTLIVRCIKHHKLRSIVSIMQSSLNTGRKVSQGRGTIQGKERTKKILKHTKNIYKERDINHVDRGIMSGCLACQGFKQGQIRLLNRRKGSYLRPTSGNAQSSHHGSGRQTRYGCAICEVSICNTHNCWDFYHHTNRRQIKYLSFCLF